MKTRNNNQREAAILKNYNNSSIYSVYSAYYSPSSYNVEAEKDIIEELQALNGWGYKVIGFNNSTFSAGYFFTVPIDGVNYTAFSYYSDYRRAVFFVGEVPWSVFKKTEALYDYIYIMIEYKDIDELYRKYEETKAVNYINIEKDGTPRRVYFVNKYIKKEETYEFNYIIELYNEIDKGDIAIAEYRQSIRKDAMNTTGIIPPYFFEYENLQEFTEAVNDWVYNKLEEQVLQYEAEREQERLEWSILMDAIL